MATPCDDKSCAMTQSLRHLGRQDQRCWAGDEFGNERREVLVGALCRVDLVRKQIPAVVEILPDLHADIDATGTGRLGEPPRILATGGDLSETGGTATVNSRIRRARDTRHLAVYK